MIVRCNPPWRRYARRYGIANQEAGAVVGMDFGTEQKMESVEVFTLDDLASQNITVSSEHNETDHESIFSIIAYWLGELRWRAKFWKRTRQ